MRKIIITIILCFLLIPSVIFGSEKQVNMYLFYGDGCPHCAQLEEYLNEYLPKHKNIKLYKYEVWKNKDNAQKLKEVQSILSDKESSGIPYLVVGNSKIVGFLKDYTEEQLNYYVSFYEKNNYYDAVGVYLGIVEDKNKEKIDPIYPPEIEKKEEKKEEEKPKETIDTLALPTWIKNIVKSSPLIISALVIGLVDGINPCAMWILLFLLSMLIGMDKKSKRWAIGTSFILSSGLIYFAFLVSWLSLANFLNSIIYIRLGIAFISVCLGIYTILKYLKTMNDASCEVVDTKGRRTIISSIKKIVKEKSIIIAILGTIVLAACVNIIELMCSLGLPVMFSQILVLNHVNEGARIIYSIIYTIAFLICDIVIFVIAMKTLEIKAISNKIGNKVHLIGGIIMLLIGALMLLKPEWLMFNF